MRLHDDEPDISPGVVRRLLSDQFPLLAGLSLEPLSNTGTDNALYRLGLSLVVRLPRIPGAARSLAAEIDWLPRLRSFLSVPVPEIVGAGTPTDAYPYPWAVLSWLPGDDAWATRDRDSWFGSELGQDLARAVLELRTIPVADAQVREPGSRGGPLAALDERVRWWLRQAEGLVDVSAVTRLWDRSLEASPYAGDPVLLHGDLIPGNLLVADGRLVAVIDWGGIGAGDPAQDLDPAWSVLNPAGAAAFRDTLDVDSQTWLRARGFALEHAIGAVIYYTSRRHPLADVMRRSLDRLLAGP